MSRRRALSGAFVVLLWGGVATPLEGDDRLNPLIALLESGRPAIGVWSGAIGATRIAKVVATSDADFIVADVEHDTLDFLTLQRFLLQVQDFNHRYRQQPRPAPAVLVKLGQRGTWDPRYEIAASLKIGPAMGVWVPFVESRADLERVISAVRHAETTAQAGVNVPRERADVWPLNPQGELLVVAMIESEEGVRNAKEIIETPGLGAIHTVHIPDADADRVRKMCLERGVIAGTDVSPSNIKAKLDVGYKLLSLGWDFGMLQRQLGETIKAVRTALPKGSH